jgi:hypothetical protein
VKVKVNAKMRVSETENEGNEVEEVERPTSK